MKPVLVLIGMLLGFAVALANEAPPLAADPVLEKRVMRLATELRCLVCQNQSLADSNADLAIDLKNQVREMVAAGRSDDEIRDYMVARYGDFVLYKPPFRAATLMLWVGPFLILAAAAGGLGFYLRRRYGRVVEKELTAVESARARALLDSRDEGVGR
jgi:cytochrome c-type biogenesis protein CcmH